jgi:hypothetical protein
MEPRARSRSGRVARRSRASGCGPYPAWPGKARIHRRRALRSRTEHPIGPQPCGCGPSSCPHKIGARPPRAITRRDATVKVIPWRLWRWPARAPYGAPAPPAKPAHKQTDTTRSRSRSSPTWDRLVPRIPKGVWRQLPGWRKSFMPKIGQRASDAQPRSNSPARTPAVNASHSAGAKISFGPADTSRSLPPGATEIRKRSRSRLLVHIDSAAITRSMGHSSG